MFGQKARGAVIAMTIVSIAAPPASACEFLRRCFGGGTTAYYAPVAPACPQPTVAYMPQTTFRTVYHRVPVTALQPMTTCDPCSGMATTVMRPVTSYVTQARLIPYTSYRPVITAGYAPAMAVSPIPAATTVAYPAVQTYAAPVATAAPSASCCSPGAVPATSFSPVTGFAPSPAPAGAVGSTITSLGPPTSVPSLAPSPALGTHSDPSAPQGQYVPQGQYTPQGTSQDQHSPADSQSTQTFEKPATDPWNHSAVDPLKAPDAAPSQAPPNDSAPNHQQPSNYQQPESRLLQPLQLNPSTSLGIPRALDPEGAEDRMTARPAHVTARLASHVADVPASNVVQYADENWQSADK